MLKRITFFPLKEIAEVSAVIDPTRGWFSGGQGEDENGDVVPQIVIGTANEIESPYMCGRIASRFGINREVLDDEAVGATVCRLVAFAHELGHIVQMNPSTRERSGGLSGEYHPLRGADASPEEYDQYVSSDEEGNADYIAACVLAHSKVGQLLGMELPEQDISEWREWVLNNPVVVTVKSS